MKELKNIIENHSMSDARSAFYYLSRYLKQASFYDEYQKDIFEDGVESMPSEVVKNLTLKMIDLIEDSQGKKSANFTDDEYMQWMNKIDAVESQLDPSPTELQLNAIEDIINELIPPKIIKDDSESF